MAAVPADVRKGSAFPISLVKILSAARLSLAAEKKKKGAAGKPKAFRTSDGKAVNLAEL